MSTHLDRSSLVAFRDHEVSLEEAERIHAHLLSCQNCQQALETFSQRGGQIKAILQNLGHPESGVSAEITTNNARKILEIRISEKQKEDTNMWNRLFAPRNRPAWITLTVILVLGLSLAIPQVRAFATGVLGIFRVQQIAVVPVDTANLPEPFSGFEPSIEKLMSDQVEYQVIGETQKVTGASEASEVAGFNVRLPEGVLLAEALVRPGVQGSFTLDVSRINNLLREMGRTDQLLPNVINGQQVTAEVPASVFAAFGDCPQGILPDEADPMESKGQIEGSMPNGDCQIMIQLPSPVLNTPAGLDVSEVGKTFLEMTGMSPSDAEAFSRRIDWSSTLVIPMPMDSMNYAEVQVDGVTGTLIHSDPDVSDSEYLLLWVKDGVVYAVSGHGDYTQALDLASLLP